MKTRIKKYNGYVADYNEAEASCEWVVDPDNATVFPDLLAAVAATRTLGLPGKEVEYLFPDIHVPAPPPDIVFTRDDLTDLWNACDYAWTYLKGLLESDIYTDGEKNAMGRKIERLNRLEAKIGKALFSLIPE